MDTKTLLDILKTRLQSSDNNPTKRCLLREVIRALERLEKFEQKSIEKCQHRE